MKDIDKELDTILVGLENSVEAYIVKRQNGGNPKSPKSIHLEAKQAIKQLINEARIDELSRLDRSSSEMTQSLPRKIGERLKELKGE